MLSNSYLSRRLPFVAVAASLLLSACTSQVAYIPRDPGRSISFNVHEKTAQSFLEVNDCTRLDSLYDAAGWPHGSDLETDREIDRRVRSQFRYKREAKDIWYSKAKHMLTSKERWAGDWDDLSATVVALSRCAGVPKERLGFALIKSNGSSTVNHMIGFYTDEQGGSHAVGDTYGFGVRPMLVPNQEPLTWMFLDDPDTWHTTRDDSGKMNKVETFSDPTKAYVTVHAS